MTTIRDLGTPGRAGAPAGPPVRGVRLVTSGVIRRARHELPAGVGPDPGRRPPRPPAPHREDRCPATLVGVRSCSSRP